MALEDIFRALDEQADSDCEALLEAARCQAASITEEATEAGNTICSSCVAVAQSAGRDDAARKLNAARLEVQKRLASAKEEAVGDVFDAARVKLATVRQSQDYPALFRSLLDEALAALDGVPVVLVDPADTSLAVQALAELKVEGEVRAEISTMGGVVVSYSDGRIMRRNTLEDRLDKAVPLVKADIAEILFS